MVWTPILSWSALAVLWDSGHIKARKKCELLLSCLFGLVRQLVTAVAYRSFQILSRVPEQKSHRKVYKPQHADGSDRPQRQLGNLKSSQQAFRYVERSSSDLMDDANVLISRSTSSPGTTAKEEPRARRSLP